MTTQQLLTSKFVSLVSQSVSQRFGHFRLVTQTFLVRHLSFSTRHQFSVLKTVFFINLPDARPRKNHIATIAQLLLNYYSTITQLLLNYCATIAQLLLKALLHDYKFHVKN